MFVLLGWKRRDAGIEAVKDADNSITSEFALRYHRTARIQAVRGHGRSRG
jgi:hypothetical protein